MNSNYFTSDQWCNWTQTHLMTTGGGLNDHCATYGVSLMKWETRFISRPADIKVFFFPNKASSWPAFGPCFAFLWSIHGEWEQSNHVCVLPASTFTNGLQYAQSSTINIQYDNVTVKLVLLRLVTVPAAPALEKTQMWVFERLSLHRMNCKASF